MQAKTVQDTPRNLKPHGGSRTIHAPLQEFKDEMARVLGQIRKNYELRNPLEAGEQEELVDKIATPNNSGHTNVLPDQEEPRDDEALSPIDNYEVYSDGQAEERLESHDYSGENVLMELSTHIETAPLSPGGSIAPPS